MRLIRQPVICCGLPLLANSGGKFACPRCGRLWRSATKTTADKRAEKLAKQFGYTKGE